MNQAHVFPVPLSSLIGSFGNFASIFSNNGSFDSRELSINRFSDDHSRLPPYGPSHQFILSIYIDRISCEKAHICWGTNLIENPARELDLTICACRSSRRSSITRVPPSIRRLPICFANSNSKGEIFISSKQSASQTVQKGSCGPVHIPTSATSASLIHGVPLRIKVLLSPCPSMHLPDLRLQNLVPSV